VRLVLERAAIFAWFMSHLWWVPAVVDRIDGADPCASLGTLQFLFAYAMVVTCVPTALLAWWTGQTLRAGQSPTPGSRVMFRTRVRTGWFARLDALGFAALAAMLAVVPVTVWREIGGLEIFLNHGC
jgi:hypothetical protein